MEGGRVTFVLSRVNVTLAFYKEKKLCSCHARGRSENTFFCVQILREFTKYFLAIKTMYQIFSQSSRLVTKYDHANRYYFHGWKSWNGLELLEN